MLKCDEKHVCCKYCNLDIAIREKINHEYICGSKTEYCANCRKYIPIKDFEAHQDIDCFPEDTYLNSQLNIDQIPVITNKKNNNKYGKIAAASKLGLLNPKKEEKVDNDLHAEQAKKIESLSKNIKKDEKVDMHGALPKKIESLSKNANNTKNTEFNKIINENIGSKYIDNTTLSQNSNKEVYKKENITTNTNNTNKINNPSSNKQIINFKEDSNYHKIQTDLTKPRDIIKQMKNAKQAILKNNISYKEMIKENYYPNKPSIKDQSQHSHYDIKETHNEMIKENYYPNKPSIKDQSQHSHSDIKETHKEIIQQHKIDLNNNKVIKPEKEIEGNVKITVNAPTYSGNTITKQADLKHKAKEVLTITNPINKQVKNMPYTKKVDSINNKNENSSTTGLKIDHMKINIENDKHKFKENINFHPISKLNPSVKENIKEGIKSKINNENNNNNNLLKKDKKSDKKNKFDQNKYIHDYLPDEFINEAQDTYDLHNKKYDIKDKPKSNNSNTNIEDEILKQVLEMSKHNK